MSTAKDAATGVFWTLVGIAVAVLLIFGYVKLLQTGQDNKDFEAVCVYEGGHTEGDVCVKNNVIILTQDQWKEKVK